MRIPAQALLRQGLEVTWTKGEQSITTKGLMETPDHSIDIGTAISANDIFLTYETEVLADMNRGDSLVAKGTSYSVTDVSPIADGTFSRATLRKL